MGYRSEVSLVITRELFSKMLRSIPEAAREMISCSDRFEAKEDSILLYWDYIKWYADIFPVDKFQQFLENVDPSDENSFHLIRLGESTNDNVEMGTYFYNPFEACISRSIEIYSSGESVDISTFI